MQAGNRRQASKGCRKKSVSQGLTCVPVCAARRDVAAAVLCEAVTASGRTTEWTENC